VDLVDYIFFHFVDNMDELEKRVKVFFNDCKRCPGDLSPSIKAEFDAIGREYKKTLEDADEKVMWCQKAKKNYC
jgi:hypothetical protein